MASQAFLAYNRRAEASLAVTYNPPYRRVVDRPEMSTFETPFSEAKYDDYLKQREYLRGGALRYQLGLFPDLVKDIQAGNQYERMWLALSTQEQRALMERALEACMQKRFEHLKEARSKFVPEIRMASLLERGGRGFIELMKRCAVPDADTLSLRYLENARFDEVAGTLAGAKSKSQHLWIKLILTKRHLVLYGFISFTWMILEGVPWGGSSTVADRTKYVQEQMGDHISSDRSKWLSCGGCFQIKGFRPDHKYMACGGCAKASPPVVLHYCSKECQRTHWKGGHKNECGGLLPLSHHAPTFEDPAPDAVVSNRTPTPLLQAHKDWIREQPEIVYILFPDHGTTHTSRGNLSYMRTIGRRYASNPHEIQEQAKYPALRQRAFDTMEGDAVMEFYLALRREVLPRKEDTHKPTLGKHSIALALKLQVAREFDIDLHTMLEEYLERMDSPPPRHGNLVLGRNPAPCSAALQRQIDANRDGNHSDASYYFFGPNNPPGGRPLYDIFSRGLRTALNMFRRWTLRSRHPALVGRLYVALYNVLEDRNFPAWCTPAALRDQFELEFEMSEAELEHGANLALDQQFMTDPGANMNMSPEDFEELMREMEF